MPALIDDGPGWVDATLVVAEADGQHRHAGHKGACPEAQNAASVPARSLWRHHQHWKALVPCPAKMPCHCHDMQSIVCLKRFVLSRVNAPLVAVDADGSLSKPGASAPVLKRKVQRPLLHPPSGALTSIESNCDLPLDQTHTTLTAPLIPMVALTLA